MKMASLENLMENIAVDVHKALSCSSLNEHQPQQAITDMHGKFFTDIAQFKYLATSRFT